MLRLRLLNLPPPSRAKAFLFTTSVTPPITPTMSFYDLSPEPDANGNEIDFATLKGKVVYAVNVASK